MNGSSDPADLAAAASSGGNWREAAEAAESAEQAAEAAEGVAEQAAAADEPAGLLGALMHTQPDADPSAVGGPPPLGEFIVGTRKVLDARGVDVGDGSGTPAIVNYARAAFGALMIARAEGRADEQSSSDGGGPGADPGGRSPPPSAENIDDLAPRGPQ